jgi:hypothetical protein
VGSSRSRHSAPEQTSAAIASLVRSPLESDRKGWRIWNCSNRNQSRNVRASSSCMTTCERKNPVGCTNSVSYQSSAVPVAVLRGQAANPPPPTPTQPRSRATLRAIRFSRDLPARATSQPTSHDTRPHALISLEFDSRIEPKTPRLLGVVRATRFSGTRKRGFDRGECPANRRVAGRARRASIPVVSGGSGWIWDVAGRPRPFRPHPRRRYVQTAFMPLREVYARRRAYGL